MVTTRVGSRGYSDVSFFRRWVFISQLVYEIHHNLKDKLGNEYPLKEECYITVSPTSKYSGDHTLEYLKEVFFPEVGVEDGTLKEPVGLVLDAF